ncbi:hypothetical protein E2C01_035066 [Portunus trituberculatus]|uniref:Uncharacterized protein n=1 Tax=Portunus trituberculatus TaxID=210409 RepID=A0A5B7F8R0_PORTR|nr:hypothetical protein [Portunus trituberculatus]
MDVAEVVSKEKNIVIVECIRNQRAPTFTPGGTAGRRFVPESPGLFRYITFTWSWKHPRLVGRQIYEKEKEHGNIK